MAAVPVVAKVTHTYLGLTQDGTMTGIIYCKVGADQSAQVGFFPFDGPSGAVAGMEFVRRCLEALDSPSWEALVGRNFFLLVDGEEQVVGVQQLPTEGSGLFRLDEWKAEFYPGKDSAEESGNEEGSQDAGE